MLHLSEPNEEQRTEAQERHLPANFLHLQQRRIEKNLRQLGAVRYDLWLPETHALPIIVHPDEHIKGIVYGRYEQDHETGRGALVATDRRVLLVNKKPLFVRCDEIAYRVVSGITYSRVAFMGIITLHTRIGNITIRTFNQNCAHNFVEAIEARISEYANNEDGLELLRPSG